MRPSATIATIAPRSNPISAPTRSELERECADAFTARAGSTIFALSTCVANASCCWSASCRDQVPEPSQCVVRLADDHELLERIEVLRRLRRRVQDAQGRVD